MGLDMYLSAKKYMSRYFDPMDSQKIEGINELFGVEGKEDEDYGAQEVTFRVAYWRKANAIHQWFVDNVQDGVDECQQAYVSREKLQELMELCEKIIASPKSGEELLPTQSGCFFGSTQYDEWYMADVKHTAERIKKILNDPAFAKGVDFYYQSSW
jgi:hypothetical protein